MVHSQCCATITRHFHHPRRKPHIYYCLLLALIATGLVGCGLQAEFDQGSSFICLLFFQHSPSLRAGFVSMLATLSFAQWLLCQVTRPLLTSRKKERLASWDALFRTRSFLTRASSCAVNLSLDHFDPCCPLPPIHKPVANNG